MVEAGQGSLRGRVTEIINLPLKRKQILTVQLRDGDVQLLSTSDFQEGDQVDIQLNRYHVFDAVSGERISSHHGER